MPNLNLVIDSSFRPYSFEERVKPYLLYKEAYDKAEAEKNALMDKAGMFKYLADATAEDEPAKAIYEGYARDLEEQAADFSKNGLTMNNRRALSNLRSRYAGEIGQLEQADKLLKAEQALRDTARAKGQQMLYANNDLRISNYLGNNKPNAYGIDTEDLRKEGALYAQTVSSGVYSDPEVSDINKYFQGILQTQGYSPEVMQAWRNKLAEIPTFDRAVEDVLKARGVTDNLTGADYERARQSVINGIMEGSIYKENRDVKQNPGQLTAAQEASNSLGWANHNESVRQHNAQMKINGFDPETGEYLGADKDPSVQKTKAATEAKIVRDKNGNPINTRSNGTTRTRARKAKPSKQFDAKGNAYDVSISNNTNRGNIISYEDAVAKYPAVAKYISADNKDLYDYFDNGQRVSVIGHADNVENPEYNDSLFEMDESVLEDGNQI